MVKIIRYWWVGAVILLAIVLVTSNWMGNEQESKKEISIEIPASVIVAGQKDGVDSIAIPSDIGKAQIQQTGQEQIVPIEIKNESVKNQAEAEAEYEPTIQGPLDQ